MTAIAIWCNHEMPENPGLWIAADSRVSTHDGSSLIEDAIKVFALPVVCRSPDEYGFFTTPYHAHTYGYSFAGDTLLGQNTFLSLVPLLSNLYSSSSYIPSFADVVNYMHTYLSLTFNACKVHRGERSVFEVALFGYCPRTAMLSAYHFSPSRESEDKPLEMTCIRHEDMQENDFIYLGSERSHMEAEIRAALQADSSPLAAFNARQSGRPLSRRPRFVVQDHISRKVFPSIGGSLQLGIANKFGFYAFPLVKPLEKGGAVISYLGHELKYGSGLQYVGEALVASQAMV